MDYGVVLSSQMKKAKLKNLTDLSYESKIPFADLKRLIAKKKLDDTSLDLLNKLKDFFGCKLSSLLIENPFLACKGNAYEPINGVVYFIKNPDTGLIKIGFTTDLINRIYNLSLECRSKLELIHYISTYDSATLESVIHQLFASKRKEGEWFDLTDEDISRFKGEQ